MNNPMKVAYLAKGPEVLPALEKWNKIADLTVVSCIPAYIDFYRYKGYKTITADEYFSLSENIMHFTYTLANPPFSDTSSGSSNNKSLDSKFNEKSRKISENVFMVLRTKHFADPRSRFRRHLFCSGTVVEIRYLPKETFPSILNTETCVLITRRDHNGPATIKYPDGTIRIKDLTKDTILLSKDPDYSGPIENNLSGRWFRGKVNRTEIANSISNDSNAIDIIEVMGTGETPTIKKVDPTLTQVGCNIHGVVMNSSAEHGGLGRVHVKKYDAAISQSVVCLRTNSEEESIKLCTYLKTDEVKELVRKNMAKFHPSRELFKNIPDPL